MQSFCLPLISLLRYDFPRMNCCACSSLSQKQGMKQEIVHLHYRFIVIKYHIVFVFRVSGQSGTVLIFLSDYL